MRSGRILLHSSAALALLLASSCRDDDCARTSTCDVALPADAGKPDASLDGGYPLVAPPSGCDPNVDPRDATACSDETYALFVDGETGDDNSPGTKLRPKKTIAAAIKIDALAGRSRIYVTAADQTGPIVLPLHLTLVGGCARVTWLPAEGTPTKLTSTTLGPVIRVASSPDRIQISDVDITPRAGVDPGESSIGVEVISATVTFRRVAIHAKAGAKGKHTDTLDNHHDGGNGRNGSGLTPGDPVTCMCNVQGTSTGGGGGGPHAVGQDGSSVPPAILTGSTTSRGGSPDCGAGAPGPPGYGGAGAKPTTLGHMTSTGWVPGDGANGDFGQPGGGGGGAAGNGSGGASGGCGGCGGAGGIGGGAGGASIGIAAYQSVISLNDVAIDTDAAGAGEVGGGGQSGQDGSPGGQTPCAGGAGGPGGGGGGGTGGAGGISVPIVYFGGSLSKEGKVTLTPGRNGSPGGLGAAGEAATNGAPGGAGQPGAVLTTMTPELPLVE